MDGLNYKHLHCFWSVAQAGSLSRAAEKLGVTPQTLSEQVKQLEVHVGTALFTRNGRGLQLTETGRLVSGYADEMFSLAQSLEDALRDRKASTTLFRVGLSDVVPKTVGYRVLQPALTGDVPVRFVCREGLLDDLLGQLAANRLDLVLADRPMPESATVRGFNHLLGESSAMVFGSAELMARHGSKMPECLHNAPMLLPGEHSAARPALMRYLADARVQPQIVGEFDDSALMKAFGQMGAGFFVGASAIADRISKQYEVQPLGKLEGVQLKYYAISVERKLSHPLVLRIVSHARESIFAS